MLKYFFLLFLFVLSSCSHTKNQTKKEYIVGSDQANSPASMEKPSILLISIDGYRHDYTEKHQPKFIKDFKERGASLASLRPSFPTKTFPNHLSIVTGRYPVHHGIVANTFYAPDLDKMYSLRNPIAVKFPKFYLSKPIWTLAEENGMKAATYFWPGSEAKIDNRFPSYYLTYDHHRPHQNRIDTVVEWFKLPKEKRPHFATVYFSDVDSAGHRFGPDSKEVKEAIHKVDASVEQLVTRLQKLNLNLNIIIVSDHGMAATDQSKSVHIDLDHSIKTRMKKFHVIGKGPIIQFYKREAVKNKEVSQLVKDFNKSAKNYQCYENKKVPKKLNFSGHSRVGDFICLAKAGWSLVHGGKHYYGGNHGWSQFDGQDMHAIFYAQGPAFRNSTVLPTASNIHIYPLLAHILKLPIKHQIDGKLEVLQKLLR